MPDFRTSPAGTHIIQPLSAWPRRRRGDDFNRITAFEFSAQWRELAIDFGGDRLIADISVDGIGKIHRRCPFGQGQYLALRRENVDGIGEEVDLYVFQKLTRVARLALDVQ